MDGSVVVPAVVSAVVLVVRVVAVALLVDAVAELEVVVEVVPGGFVPPPVEVASVSVAPSVSAPPPSESHPNKPTQTASPHVCLNFPMI